MEAVLEKLSIDKSTWTLVKLGDVVAEPKENAKDLQTEGIDKVVGLEHIDTEDVHLRRFAGLEDSTTFTKKFRKGDILFGRRRAYLKKAAQAPFSGICSGDITVLRAKKGILPELLPFVICNDKFFDYTVKHSAGGLSPRVKFKDLANYEFLLPPKEQQAQLAELLWAMDEVIEKEKEVLKRLDKAYIINREQSISNPIFCKIPLSNIVRNIITYGIVQPGPNVESGVKYIQSSDIKDGKISNNLSKTSFQVAKAYLRSEVSAGDVLFSLRGNLGATAIVPINYGLTNIARGVARISPKNNFDSHYIKFALETSSILKRIVVVSQGSTFKEVSLDTLRKLKIPMPKDLEQQKKISKTLIKFKSLIETQISRLIASKELQKSLINQIF